MSEREPAAVVRAYLDAVGALDLDARILPTDRAYRNTYVSRFRVVDGAITSFAEYFDPLVLVEALGGTLTMPGQEVSA